MRSFSARGFSFSKLRKLSTANVSPNKKQEILALEENSLASEPNPSDGYDRPSYIEENPYGSSDEDTSPGPVLDRFDQNYLESRANLLAYGKQMKRDHGIPPLSPPPAFLAHTKRDEGGILSLSPPPAYPAEEVVESESSPKDNQRNSKQGVSWLSRVRRSPRNEDDGSKSRRKLLSPRRAKFYDRLERGLDIPNLKPLPYVPGNPEVAVPLDHDTPDDEHEKDDIDKGINPSASEEYQTFQPEAHRARSTLPAVQNILDMVFGVDESVHPPPPLGLGFTSGGLVTTATMPWPQVPLPTAILDGVHLMVTHP
ncbi:hypothetical protein R1flu_006407 [Riccia fluitans]|uniref:Uncharacterized protein n=1 Tax=Riccia fluitans TaxID=41844 RepID=A0ABD1YWM4_9MARC